MMPGKENLYERYSDYTDEQIFVILRNHKNYQTDAVGCAVKIAVERGIINSEQDLFSPEFQRSNSLGGVLFGISTDVYYQQKLMGSIFRFLYVMSFIPFIYGFLKFGEGQTNQTIIGVSIGLVWFVLCFLLKKTRKQIILLPILLVLLSVSTIIGIKILSNESIKILDLVMLFIGTILPFYLLILLKKLIQLTAEKI